MESTAKEMDLLRDKVYAQLMGATRGSSDVATLMIRLGFLMKTGGGTYSEKDVSIIAFTCNPPPWGTFGISNGLGAAIDRHSVQNG